MIKFRRRARRVAVAGLAAVALLLGAFVGYVQLTWKRPVVRPVVAMIAPRDTPHVLRGQYLYEQSLLCWNCHGSQGGHGPNEAQAGGREFGLTRVGPGFGYVYGSNLTPDIATGIGGWSDGELVRAIREGVNRDGHVIFPVMAYQFYHGLSDEDTLALVAYLRSLPPLHNEVSPKRLSFAAKALQAISLIRPETPITQAVRAPRAAPTVEYGEYVAWRMSGCAECHTPRDPKTAHLALDRLMAGGLFPFPEDNFIATGSNLTPDIETGIGGWTEEQFITAVRTGVRPNGTVMLPFMPWPSYARWSRDDLHAVWLYLRSLKPISHRVAVSSLVGAVANAKGPARGQAIDGTYCLTCHGNKGEGSPFTSVPLKDVVRNMDDESIRSFIAEGPPGTVMPGFGKTLTEDQIMDVIKFARSW